MVSAALQQQNHRSYDSEMSSSFGTDLCDDADNKEEEDAIADRETKAVRSLKLLVFLVLSMSAIGVSLAVYFYISDSEQTEFEDQFQDEATKVLAELGASLDQTLTATDAFVVAVISHANSTNQTWPFVTIPNFAIRSQKIRSLANAVVMNFYLLVENDQRKEWEQYSKEHNYWVNESIKLEEDDTTFTGPILYNWSDWNVIFGNDEYDKPEDEQGVNGTDRKGPYLPTWQIDPVIPRFPPYNWDLMNATELGSVYAVAETHKISLSAAYMIAYPNDTAKEKVIDSYADWYKDFIPRGENPREPMSDIYYPIILEAINGFSLFQRGDYNVSAHKYAGILNLSLYWRDWLKDILPEGSNGIVAVFENECNPTFTYQINGPNVVYRGTGDLHDPQYDYMAKPSALLDLRKFAVKNSSYSGVPINEEYCPFYVTVYPSDEMKDKYISSNAILFSVSAFLIFLFTSLTFVLYDFWVERRQKLVLKTAVDSNAIVSSLFPSTVRDRVFHSKEESTKLNGFRNKKPFRAPFGVEDEQEAMLGPPQENLPIADLFPEATVFFADIAGFTAWSSERPPSQVFILLETLYGAFDTVAEKRGVFKVETIGDCYVAVTGIPKPQKLHAVIMARFASQCREKMHQLTSELEVTLGPGTSDLKLRIGMHSGPVTAGVLRGQRARFQLFGDTVNTASRMESNGQPNRIHVSQKTADYITAAGRGHWLTKRPDLITAKGKGKLQTYWLETRGGGSGSVVSSSNDEKKSDSHREVVDQADNSDHGEAPIRRDTVVVEVPDRFSQKIDKMPRLVDWCVSLLEELLRGVVTYRKEIGLQPEEVDLKSFNFSDSSSLVRDEVTDVINFPFFNKAYSKLFEAELSPEVLSQLRGYVTAIACSYPQNAFHNFEHASHVAMSARTLIRGMISNGQKSGNDVMVTFDPLTKFTLVLAALISDVDHPGVTNEQLVSERSAFAARYENKSLSEQNSLDIAWNLLMDPGFCDLQRAIFTTTLELRQFRQVLVNAVMATDLIDHELIITREERWKRTFGSESAPDDTVACRRATVAIDFIMQAATVSHRMQHWHVYQKWNECLSEEMYHAYKIGRCPSNPINNWYQHELEVFDHIVIPLATKMREFGEYGVNEYLNFAMENREEWARTGQGIVEEWALAEQGEDVFFL